jgi:hypothetical protein
MRQSGETMASRSLVAARTPRLMRHQWTMIVTVIAMFMVQETM